MENGNLNVMGGNLTQCLSPPLVFPLQIVLVTASTRQGECVLLRAGQLLAGARAILILFLKQKKKGTRVHKFQEDQKEEGKELWSPLLLLPTLCVSGLLIRVKSCSPSGSAQSMPKRIMALLDWLTKSKQCRSCAPSLLPLCSLAVLSSVPVLINFAAEHP